MSASTGRNEAVTDREDPYETAFIPPAITHLPDLDHPWVGLESFRDDTRAYFFGRDTEISELHLRLRSHPLLVVYGQSGLGKTSILTAGLIPRLRAEGKRPLLVRLRYDNPALDPTAQFVAAVFGWGEHQDGRVGMTPHPTKSLPWVRRLADRLGVQLPEDHASRLWLRLHYREKRPEISHLIFDQFEEVFTLGGSTVGVESAVRDALSILIQGAIPEPIARVIAEHDGFLDVFDPDSVAVRVVLALRDDYIYALNRWLVHLPALGQNNFELRALTGPAAFDAVFKPGELRCRYRSEISDAGRIDTGLPPIIYPDTAERIVRFVARRAADVSLADIEAVPPILSLLCRELNERRFSPRPETGDTPGAQIAFSETDADIETIINTFYERCLVGCPEAVRIFVEEDLVSYSGARVAQDEESILNVFQHGCEISGALARHAAGFGDPDAARACLNDLVSRRLLSPLVDKRYELIHDLLAAIVTKSRAARIDRLRKEDADRAAQQEREAKEAAQRQARVTRRHLSMAAGALVVAIVAAAVSFVQYERAKGAESNATRARDEGEKLIGFMTMSLRDKLDGIGRLDILIDVNRSVEEYYDSFATGKESPEVLRRRSFLMINKGDVMVARGDLVGALQSYRAGMAIRGQLVKQDPANATWQREFAISLDYVGDVLREQGDRTGALSSYSQAMAIRETHVKQDGSDERWLRDLAVSYSNIGDVQSDQGDLVGASKSYRDSLALHERLARMDTRNFERQRDISLVYEKIGDTQNLEGNRIGALESYQQSLTIAEKLVRLEPKNARWRRDLSVSYEKVSDMQSVVDGLDSALYGYRSSLAIREGLARQDRSNARWQRDLSLSYERQGDVQRAVGDLASALKSYSDVLEIRGRLVRTDPGNAIWQRDLSVSYEKMAEVLTARGDLASALQCYQASLAIREQLVIQDPRNVGWMGDLAFSRWRMGRTLRRVDSKGAMEGRAMVVSARDTLQEMKGRTGLNGLQQEWLAAIDAELRDWR